MDFVAFLIYLLLFVVGAVIALVVSAHVVPAVSEDEAVAALADKENDR